MNEIQIFNHEQFGQVRMIDFNGEPWAAGKDVATGVGYKNPLKAIRDHVDDEDKMVNDSFTVNGTPIIWINESGIHSLVLSSKLESAKKFKRWVTSEVLPSIRKHGSYTTAQGIMNKYSNPRELAKLLNDYADAQDKNVALEAEIEANKPKVEFADALLVCENCIYIEELAKLLCQIGMNTGRNRLFEEMASDGFLCVRNGVKNMPTQKCVENGWLVIEKKVFERGGKTIMGYTTKVTPKGIQYFISYYKRKHGLEPVLTTSRRRVIEQRQVPRQLRAGHNQAEMH